MGFKNVLKRVAAESARLWTAQQKETLGAKNRHTTTQYFHGLILTLIVAKIKVALSTSIAGIIFCITQFDPSLFYDRVLCNLAFM